MPKNDDRILKLKDEVAKRKNELSRLEKPDWKTKCQFQPDGETLAGMVNLHVTTCVKKLVLIAAEIMNKKRQYEETVKLLEVIAPDFTWQGSTLEDWLADIKMRIDKIQIEQKRKSLQEMEKKLYALLSPEARQEMELEEIEKALK